jgi:hypothetical protein
MAIDLTCPCGKKLRIGEEHGGKQGRCPLCGRVLDIPSPGTAVPPAPVPLLRYRPVEMPPAPKSALPPPFDLTRALSSLGRSKAPGGPPYSPGAVAAATIFGSLLGGFAILGLNYHRMKRRAAARLSFLGGGLSAVVCLAMVLSPSWKTSALFSLHLFSVLVMFLLAQGLQGARYARYARQGGDTAPAGRAAGLGMLFAFFLVVMGVAGHAFLRSHFGGTVILGGVPGVRFSPKIRPGEAERVGRLLQVTGISDHKSCEVVRLDRNGTAYVVTLVIPEQFWDDRELLAQLAELWDGLTREAFPGSPVVLQLEDGTAGHVRTLWGGMMAE